MINDEDRYVRSFIARRIDQKGLHKMINDKSEYVKSYVVNRIDQVGLHKMINDKSEYIRNKIVERIDQTGLHKMINDDDKDIRVNIVKNINVAGLHKMKSDKDEHVRYMALTRIKIINNAKLMSSSYEKGGKIVLSKHMKSELKNIIKKDDHSTNIIEYTNEFYKNINNGKFNDFHLKSKADWESSSSSSLALLLKDSIKRQFGGKIRYHGNIKDYDGEVNKLYHTHKMKDVDKYVKIQKDLTRKYLDEMFPDIDIITLYRGTSEEEIQNLNDNDNKVIVKSNPLSSWTLKEEVANKFSVMGGGSSVVLTTEVHKDEIWSTFMSHAHLGNEREILLIGNKDREVSVI